MSSDKQALELAIGSMTKAVESIEKQISDYDVRIEEEREKREQSIHSFVENHLPDSSNVVMLDLMTRVPGFLNRDVRKAFSENSKFLGIFATKRYKKNLSLLKTNLASYLDQIGERPISSSSDIINIVNKYNDSIKDLVENRAAFVLRSKDAMKLLEVLQEAYAKNAPIPPTLKQRVVELGQSDSNRKKFAESRHGRHKSELNASATSRRDDSSMNDDSAFWFWYITGIPTDTRTLMFDAIYDHQHEIDAEQQRRRVDDSEEETRSGRYDNYNDHRDQGADLDSGSGSTNMDTSSFAAVGGAVAAGAAAVGVASLYGDQIVADSSANIATDDSLGSFS